MCDKIIVTVDFTVAVFRTFLLISGGYLCRMTQSKGALGKASGMAIAGLILGIVGVCLGFIGVLCASCVCAVAGPMGCMNPGYADLVGAASQLSKYFN